MTKDKDEDEPKPVLTPGFATHNIIFEQLGTNAFLVFDRVTGEITEKSFLEMAGLTYQPLPRIPWHSCIPPVDPSPDLVETRDALTEKLNDLKFQGEYGTEEDLFNEIRQFFMEHLDVQDPLWFDIYANFVLMTWRLEDWRVVPYQFFLGPLSSGKTRGLECFNALCYRALMAASMSAATIFRTLESWHCTLLLDETEIYNRDAMVEVLALLNAGYRRGQYALRIEKLEGQNPTIAMFDVFGPKVLAGTQELAATLQSRAIPTKMCKNVKHVRLFVDEEKAQELRNKLLMYRFRNLGHESEFDVTLLNGEFSNSRIIELFVSLLEVAPTQGIRTRLIQCMKVLTQSRLDEEQTSIEAQVFEAILRSEAQIDAGKLSIRTVTENFNLGLPENEQVTPKFIGRRIAALGFEKCRMSGGLRGFFWTKELVDRLKARYFPSDSVPKTTSQTSQKSQTSLDTVNLCQPKESASDVSDEIPSVIDSAINPDNDVKSDVSDETDVSDVEKGTQSRYEEE